MPADLVVLATDMSVAEDGEIARLSEESFRKLDEVLQISIHWNIYFWPYTERHK